MHVQSRLALLAGERRDWRIRFGSAAACDGHDAIEHRVAIVTEIRQQICADVSMHLLGAAGAGRAAAGRRDVLARRRRLALRDQRQRCLCEENHSCEAAEEGRQHVGEKQAADRAWVWAVSLDARERY